MRISNKNHTFVCLLHIDKNYPREYLKMGRAKREVPTGKLFLKYPKKGYDNNKEYTLFFYYSWDRKTMTKDTQYRVKVKDWNANANNGRGALCSTYGSDYKRCNNP